MVASPLVALGWPTKISCPKSLWHTKKPLKPQPDHISIHLMLYPRTHKPPWNNLSSRLPKGLNSYSNQTKHQDLKLSLCPLQYIRPRLNY